MCKHRPLLVRMKRKRASRDGVGIAHINLDLLEIDYV